MRMPCWSSPRWRGSIRSASGTRTTGTPLWPMLWKGLICLARFVTSSRVALARIRTIDRSPQGPFWVSYADMAKVAVIAEATSLGVLAPPGPHGFDICVGEGQAWGIPTQFGGPYVGFMVVKDALQLVATDAKNVKSQVVQGVVATVKQ